MKKTPLFFLVLLSVSCSVFRSKVKPYPTGVIFPLEEVGQVAFKGQPKDTLVKGEGACFYISTENGHLYCVDGGAQRVSWHFNSPSPFGCPPVLGPDRLFVWDKDNIVFCFDLHGKVVWKAKVPDKISTPISRDRERIYVGTEGGDLLALSQATGELLWRFRTKGAIAAAAVFYRDSIIQGSSDGLVYLLSTKGAQRGAIDLGSPISVAPLVDGDRLYVGTDDFSFYCYDLKTKKRKWTIKAGGRLLITPSADQKRVYFQASNSVLYALDKRGGAILWWWIAPSRNFFELGFDAQKILATSRSPLLFLLDGRSGKVIGSYESKSEIRSNPIWAEPNVVFATFDPSADRGLIAFLRKQVKVVISSSLASPQPAGTEIIVTASATGFYRPQYEFYVRRGEERSVLQKASDKNSWAWYADTEGSCSVGVRVTDERQAKEAEIPFEISKNEKKTSEYGLPERSQK